MIGVTAIWLMPKKIDSWMMQKNRLSVQHTEGVKSLPWNGKSNNGLAEGSVNKIKVIKRIMYGRSSFDLLKAKVLFHELFHIEIN